MTRKITRRDAGRLLVAAPVALSMSGAGAAAQTPPKPTPKPPAPPKLSKRQRKDLAKAREGLEKAASAVRAMKIPIGTEPAFVFRPVGSKP